jgi:hypothetical protein
VRRFLCSASRNGFAVVLQEEVRLRIFNEHLKKQAKSAVAGRRKMKHETKLPPDANRPTTPEKREEMRTYATLEMSKARKELAAAKAFHEQWVQLTASRSAPANGLDPEVGPSGQGT